MPTGLRGWVEGHLYEAITTCTLNQRYIYIYIVHIRNLCTESLPPTFVSGSIIRQFNDVFSLPPPPKRVSRKSYQVTKQRLKSIVSNNRCRILMLTRGSRGGRCPSSDTNAEHTRWGRDQHMSVIIITRTFWNSEMLYLRHSTLALVDDDSVLPTAGGS